jgi:rod shape-determining protein MreC
MQQIFNFIFKNSHRLLFLLLLVISFMLTVQSHSFQRSKVISSANFLTGGVYEKVNNVSEYFKLKSQNEILANENAELKKMLLNLKDTSQVPELDVKLILIAFQFHAT